jgi:hypothetical protein
MLLNLRLSRFDLQLDVFDLLDRALAFVKRIGGGNGGGGDAAAGAPSSENAQLPQVTASSSSSSSLATTSTAASPDSLSSSPAAGQSADAQQKGLGFLLHFICVANTFI